MRCMVHECNSINMQVIHATHSGSGQFSCQQNFLILDPHGFAVKVKIIESDILKHAKPKVCTPHTDAYT